MALKTVATQLGSGGGGTPGGTSGQLQYNNAGSFGGMSGTAWNDTTRSLTLSGATVTASAPVFDLSQTWNNAAVTFTGLKFNATDTASASGSLLMDVQKDGTSVFSVRKDNKIGPTGLSFIQFSNSQQIFLSSNATTVIGRFNSNGLTVPATSSIGFTDSTPDVILTRRAAANLRFGAADAAAPVAQTLSVQSVVAGTSNTAGANLTITGSQGTGTGAGGSIIFQVAPAGASGTAQNALVNALTIGGSSDISLTINGTSPTIIGPGNTGRFTFSGPNAALNYGGVNNAFGIALISSNGGTNTNLVVHSVGSIGFSSTSSANAAMDTILARDAANTLALRNGTNAQTFNIYNTYTDASNYERAVLGWSSNAFRISTGNAGTGSTRSIQMFSASANIDIVDGSSVCQINFNIQTGNGIRVAGTRPIGFTSGDANASAPDVTLRRVAAGILGIRSGTLTDAGALSFIEQTAPAAPAANGVYIYAEDDGAGKTRLMARFATGAAQQIAIEP